MSQYHFLEIDPDNIIVAMHRIDWPDEGPPPMPEVLEGNRAEALSEAISMTGPTATSRPRWRDGAVVWEETATLEELKAAKRAEITRERLAADADHFMYQDKAIRTADKDMIDLFSTNGYVALFGEFDASWPGGWKTIDNSYLPIATVDEWKPFYKAMYCTGIANFRKSQELKAAIDAATTAEQVNSITWNSEAAA
jgi:hypothetical protein